VEGDHGLEFSESEKELKALLVQLLKAPLDEMSTNHLAKMQTAVEACTTTSSRKVLGGLNESLSGIKTDISELSDRLEYQQDELKGIITRVDERANQLGHLLTSAKADLCGMIAESREQSSAALEAHNSRIESKLAVMNEKIEIKIRWLFILALLSLGLAVINLICVYILKPS
jgi:ABC-type transporter Mla subunit MlaD